MGASKRYKGKDCAYCAKPGSSSTNDHVIPKSFFLDDERNSTLELPQVPACQDCNNKKSKLELYVGSSLLIGSNHPEAGRYLREKIAPRLQQNPKLWAELNLDAPPQFIEMNGIFQLLHRIKINPAIVEQLLQMIVLGLYRYHYGKPLSCDMRPEVKIIRPEAEAGMWASVADYFPPTVPRITRDLGRGNFRYSCVQSPAHDGFTAWVLGFHGGIHLFGRDGSVDH